MLKLLRFLFIMIVVYSFGFLSGMRYQGNANEAEALKEDLLKKKDYIKEKGQSVIDSLK